MSVAKCICSWLKKKSKDDESDITSESVEYDLEIVNTTEAQMDNIDKSEAIDKDTYLSPPTINNSTSTKIVEQTKSTTSNHVEKVDESDSEDIPDRRVFPLYFSFMVWGPFDSMNNRLALLLTDEIYKSKNCEIV